MRFISPIWLVALVPWAALAVWLLIGRRDEAQVPFLHLWPKGSSPARAGGAFQPPPLALIMLLVALLLAVLGAAGPMLSAGTPVHLTIIVDRDVTMSARLDKWDRLTTLREVAGEALRRAYGLGPAEVIAVPGGSQGESVGWVDRLHGARMLQPVSMRTTDALRSAVNDALSRAKGPVIVLSDQSLMIEHQNLVQVTLREPMQNVGIARLAAREHPAAQVMVVVRNDSRLRHAELRISSAGHTVQRRIELPTGGAKKSYFVDMPSLGPTVAVELLAADDLAADNYAWLVRQRSWPRIEARAGVPAEMQRMIETYRKNRPSDDGFNRVAVTMDPRIDEPAAIVGWASAAEPVRSASALRVSDHPICGHVDWQRVTASGARTARPPEGSWTPLVSRGEQVLIAARELPARQVWVGLASEAWARESDFVIFWTNAFEWLGADAGDDGVIGFAGEPVRPLSGGWRRRDDLSGSGPLPIAPSPGVWGREDGAIVAMNVLDVSVEPIPQTDWRIKLANLRPQPGGRGNLAPAAHLTALLAAAVAFITWRAR